MIDYFFRWATSSNAEADAFAVAQKFGFTELSSSGPVWSWARDHVLPDIKAWRPSQDTVSSGIVTHTYLAGWFAIVSIDRQVNVLLNSSQLAFALDRDGPPYVVKNNIGAIINDVACQPIFAGSHYPVGGYSS